MFEGPVFRGLNPAPRAGLKLRQTAVARQIASANQTITVFQLVLRLARISKALTNGDEGQQHNGRSDDEVARRASRTSDKRASSIDGTASRARRGRFAAGLFAHSRPRFAPGPEPDCGQYARRDENQQHDRLNDGERRFGLGWRKVMEESNLHEPLYDEDEHIEIERGDGAADIDEPPNSDEVKCVIAEDGAEKQDQRQNADRARRIETERRQREAAEAGEESW